MCVDSRQEFGRSEGLGHIVHGTYLETHDDIADFYFRGEENDGDIPRRGVALESPARLVAVYAWHHHVEQDQIGHDLANQVQRRLAL